MWFTNSPFGFFSYDAKKAIQGSIGIRSSCVVISFLWLELRWSHWRDSRNTHNAFRGTVRYLQKFISIVCNVYNMNVIFVSLFTNSRRSREFEKGSNTVQLVKWILCRSVTDVLSGLHTVNLSLQTRRVAKLKLVCVKDTTTVVKHVGKLLARIETSSIVANSLPTCLPTVCAVHTHTNLSLPNLSLQTQLCFVKAALEKSACSKLALACAFKRNQVLSWELLNLCIEAVVGCWILISFSGNDFLKLTFTFSEAHLDFKVKVVHVDALNCPTSRFISFKLGIQTNKNKDLYEFILQGFEMKD